MTIKQVAKIGGGQDGAIWKNELFRLETDGRCWVYDLRDIRKDQMTDLQSIASFVLDRAESIVPHSNAVCWGADFFDSKDEYPLLYSNIYNNYANHEDKLIGVCCVYRVQRKGKQFTSTLVQLIEIGFVEDSTRWRAYPDRDGKRPYGNFLVDRVNRKFYAFVMRSEELGTAYFQFDLPSVNDGDPDPIYGVKRVVLGVDDVRASFDCPFHQYIQGAAMFGEHIYSTEGFGYHEIHRPAIRIISVKNQKQECCFDLMEQGIMLEPEMIDFYQGDCYYSDAHGNLYIVDFS